MNTSDMLLTTCANELEQLREEITFWRDMANRGVSIYSHPMGENSEIFDVYSHRKWSTILDPSSWGETGRFATLDDAMNDVKKKLNWKRALSPNPIVSLKTYKVTAAYNVGFGPQYLDLDDVYANTQEMAQVLAEKQADEYFDKKFINATWEEVKVRPVS